MSGPVSRLLASARSLTSPQRDELVRGLIETDPELMGTKWGEIVVFLYGHNKTQARQDRHAAQRGLSVVRGTRLDLNL